MYGGIVIQDDRADVFGCTKACLIEKPRVPLVNPVMLSFLFNVNIGIYVLIRFSFEKLFFCGSEQCNIVSNIYDEGHFRKGERASDINLIAISISEHVSVTDEKKKFAYVCSSLLMLHRAEKQENLPEASFQTMTG